MRHAKSLVCQDEPWLERRNASVRMGMEKRAVGHAREECAVLIYRAGLLIPSRLIDVHDSNLNRGRDAQFRASLLSRHGRANLFSGVTPEHRRDSLECVYSFTLCPPGLVVRTRHLQTCRSAANAQKSV